MIAIAHVGLAVPDIEKAIDWYIDVLDFRLIAGPYSFHACEEKVPNTTQDLQGAHVKRMKNAHLTAGNGVGLELFEFVEPRMEKSEPPGHHTGFFHLCLVVDDVDAAAEKIERKGGKRVSEKWNTRPGKPYFLRYCEDPFGNTIELYSHSTELMYGNRE